MGQKISFFAALLESHRLNVKSCLGAVVKFHLLQQPVLSHSSFHEYECNYGTDTNLNVLRFQGSPYEFYLNRDAKAQTREFPVNQLRRHFYQS